MRLTHALAMVVAVVLIAGCNPKPEKKMTPESKAPAAQTAVPAAPASAAPPAAQPAAEVWTCPMHPEVKEAKAGKCPKCGMDLVKAPAAAPMAPPAAPAPAPAAK